jgi:preprotein translocase subunit Sec63
VAEDEENRRRAGITGGPNKVDDAMSDKDKGELREVIVSLISESTRGLDKAGVMRAFRLEVGSGGASELKMAYRRAAIRYHPDKNRNVGIRQRIFAEEAFKAISQKMEAL